MKKNLIKLSIYQFYIYYRYNKLDDLFIKVFNVVFEDFYESYSIYRDRGLDDIYSQLFLFGVGGVLGVEGWFLNK